MARARTIQGIEDSIRWQADMQEAELRHTSVDLRRAINQSIQRYRERISENGHPYFLKSHSGLVEKGAGSDSLGNRLGWGVLETASIDPPIVRLYGVDLTANNITVELDSVEFRERNYYNSAQTWNGIPEAFFGYDETKIGLLPPPSREYRYTLWYLPLLPDLMEDSDEFNPGIPGGEEWVVWDVFVKLLARDNYPRLIQFAMAERDALWLDLLRRASSHQRTGAVKRLDTRQRSKDKRWRLLRGWRSPGV